IANWAFLSGITNDQKSLILVFSHNTDANGDSIQARNKKTGEFVFTIFPLAFQEAATASKAKGSLGKHFAYVYNLYQPGPAVGSAIFDETMSMGRNGETNRFAASGELQWFEKDNAAPHLRISSAKF